MLFEVTNHRYDKTKAHSTHALQQRQQNNIEEVTIASYPEYVYHEKQNQRRLSAHYNELYNNVRCNNFEWCNSSHP